MTKYEKLPPVLDDGDLRLYLISDEELAADYSPVPAPSGEFETDLQEWAREHAASSARSKLRLGLLYGFVAGLCAASIMWWFIG